MNFLHAKNLGKILTLTLVLVIGVSLVAMPHALAATSTGGSGVPQVNPQANGFSLLGLNMVDMVNSIFANLVNAILGVTSIFVAITGQLLNFSIVVTLHIKDFVDNTPAIYAIWSVIRDVASLFFIFFLLYEAIKIILNTSASYGKTLVNIVAAGILINFSFFIVSIGIDASNIISQAIYNSILPNQPAVSFSGGASLANIATTFNGGSGGLSGIFMSNLKVTTFYNAQSLNFTAKDGIGQPLKIIFIGAVGVVIMITAALSFALASAAFIVRLIILLFLLAFSPFWFAGFVIPGLSKKFDFKGTLISQLIFMPVYLLLLYAALKILSTANIMGAGANISLAGIGSGTNWMTGYIILAINFAFVIVMLNMPLFVGLKMGGMATDWMKKTMDNFDAKKIWGNVGGYVGTNALGRPASWIDKKLANTRIGNSYYGRDIRSATIGALAKNKYGGSRAWEDKTKIIKEVGKKNSEIDRMRAFEQLGEGHIASAMQIIDPTAPMPASMSDAYKSVMGRMSEKEKIAQVASLLGKDKLKDPNLLRHLKKSDFEAIKKSDDFTEDDKREIADARKETFKLAVTSGNADIVKDMNKWMEGSDLMGMQDILTEPTMIDHLNGGQLRAMDEAGLDDTIKHTIGHAIEVWPATHGGRKHPAFGYAKKNKDSWGLP